MLSDSTALVWFRRDFRLNDNPALDAALATGLPVIALYIHAPEEEGHWAPGGASCWWLHHALADLDEMLQAHRSLLTLRCGASQAVLEDIIRDHGVKAVFWNRLYEPKLRDRDRAIKTALKERGIDVQSFNGALLNERHTISNQSGKPFQVFTPYWRHCCAGPLAEPVKTRLEQWTPNPKPPASTTLGALSLLPRIPWDKGFYSSWIPTRKGGLARLNAFLKDALDGYSKQRDIPGTDGTSRLSPYLHFGQISPREVAAALKQRDALTGGGGGPKYYAELGWREFSYHLMYHFPHTPEEPLRSEFAHFPWETDNTLLDAWKHGQTGYPIVDAGMRQLWQTGWMHNRVRMIVASLLVKHLLQPWQEGARWFWDTLVDADLASNTQGWQWSAGCGADAAPYFRVFNPTLQGEKFDPEGTYTRTYVPELEGLENRYLHQPWAAPENVLKRAGITLGVTYPKPVVELNEGRNRALQAYEKLKHLRGK
jgi:deoxyribodipyrimidine photo-lyase